MGEFDSNSLVPQTSSKSPLKGIVRDKQFHQNGCHQKEDAGYEA